MKKIIALLLALLTVLSVSSVCAAETAKPADASAETSETEDATAANAGSTDAKDASGIAQRWDIEKKAISADREATPMTADTVTIDRENSRFTVVTESGTELSVTVPFGAYCITQDICQQLDIYLSLYTDVGAALKDYVNHGVHMDLYNFYTGQSVYVTESADTFAAMTGDLNKLDYASRKQVAEYLSKYWFGNYPAKLKTVGGNTYVAFDLAQDCGFVVYNTIVGGRLIEIYTVCDNGKAGMDEIDRMIAALTFGQSAPAPEEEPEPTQALPEETQPEQTQLVETQPVETQPVETQPVETQPEETVTDETLPEQTEAK